MANQQNPTIIQLLNEVAQSVEDGHSETALNQLKTVVEQLSRSTLDQNSIRKYSNDVLVLQARWSKLKQKDRNELIDIKDSRILHNGIDYSILDLRTELLIICQELEKKSIDQDAPADVTGPYLYHYFISHSTQDQLSFVKPLVQALEQKGLRIWFSGKDIGKGNSIARSINHGIPASQSWIVVFSKNALQNFTYSWVEREVDTIIEFEGANRLIIPIYLGVSPEEVKQTYPLMARNLGLRASNGMAQIVERLVKTQNPYTNLFQLVEPFTNSLDNPSANTQARILVLPFNTLVENPQRNLKLKLSLESKLKELGYENELQFQVLPLPDVSPLISPQEAEQLGADTNADLVIWGDLYDEGASFEVQLQYQLSFQGKQFQSTKRRNSKLFYQSEDRYSGFVNGTLKTLLHWMLGLHAYWNQDYQTAISFLTKIPDTNTLDSNEKWYRLGICYHEIKNYQEAIACYEKVDATSSLIYKTWINWGNVHLEMGELDKAYEMYQKVADQAAYRATVLNNLAVLADLKGKREKASYLLEEAQAFGSRQSAAMLNKQLLAYHKEEDFWIQKLIKQSNEIVSYRNHSSISIEKLESESESHIPPFLLLNDIRIPIASLFVKENNSAWGLKVGEKENGQAVIKPLRVSGNYLLISRQDVFETQKESQLSQTITVKRELFKINIEESTGGVVASLQFILPDLIAFYVELDQLLAKLNLHSLSGTSLVRALRVYIEEKYGFISEIEVKMVLRRKLGFIIGE